MFSIVVAAQAITSIIPHMLVFGRAASAAAEMFDLIDRTSSIDPFDDSGEAPKDVVGKIRVENVSFSYPSRPDMTVLDDFTLDVPAGKVTALVVSYSEEPWRRIETDGPKGPSGSGKSTIVGLLERWYDPTRGRITLDGRDIKHLNLRWLRTNIRLVQQVGSCFHARHIVVARLLRCAVANVAQEPVLFNGSVFENIANGLVGTIWEDSPVEEKRKLVEDAAKLSFAHDFIVDLAHGYDTSIGQRGGLLSGGQKQRIAIARSIVSDPRILLLDEATSALDPHAEGIVQQALDRASKNRTTITIAHKLATIRSADNIVVMSQGCILEQGSHEHLATQGGLYEKLVRAQDLAPSNEVSRPAVEDEPSDSETAVPVSLTKTPTREVATMHELQNREDFGNYKPLGLVYTLVKLVGLTPELTLWYSITLLTCIAGGESLFLWSLY